MADYHALSIRQVLCIRKLYSLHYFQFAAGYIFPGERHDFWEMVYMDHGEADIGADGRTYLLRQGEAIFHKPNEFHTIWANHATGPNIMVVAFASSSHVMRFFHEKVFILDVSQRRILQQIIVEGRRTFGPLLDISNLCDMQVRTDAPVGGLQLIGNYLEQLLLALLRSGAPAKSRRMTAPRLTGEQHAAEVTQNLQRLMRQHLDGSLRFQDLCHASGMSAAALKQLFHQYNEIGVMACYQRLRMEEARRMLREGRYNITEIADQLGYASIHYFSSQFKRLNGLAPSVYQKTVQG